MNTITATSTEILDRLIAGARCSGCAGSGKRGRGTCKACSGKGTADLSHPRIRFNHGFHDATLETELGIKRAVDTTNPGGWFYAVGYAAGLRAVANGAPRPTSSDPAWATLVAPIVQIDAYERAMGEWI